jgi:hypothetical protein
MKEELDLHFHKHLFSPVVIACQNQFASAAAYEIITLCTTALLQSCTTVPSQHKQYKT